MQKRAAKKACGWTRLVALWGGIIGKFRVNSLIGRAATQQRWNDLKQGVDENFTTFVERVDACAEELNNLYAASGSSKRVDAEDKKTKFLLCLNPTSKEMFSATIKSMSTSRNVYTVDEIVDSFLAEENDANISSTNTSTGYANVGVHGQSGAPVKACFKFDGRNGSCPFGSRCRFVHIMDRAAREREQQKSRRAVGRQGNSNNNNHNNHNNHNNNNSNGSNNNN